MSVLFTDQYFLLVSLLSTIVGHELIDEHLDEDKHKQDGDGAGRQRKKNLGIKKFLPVIGLLSLTDYIQLKI